MRIRRTVVFMSGLAYGDAPAINWNSVAASEYTSAAGDARLSSSTSGAAYATDTPLAPLWLRSSSIVEMPKSPSAGSPYADRKMLCGLMSRCSTPASWAVCSAPQMRTPTASTSSIGSGPISSTRSR